MKSHAPNWPALLSLAVSQASYFATEQAAVLGFSSELLIHHLRAARLQRVQRGIYRVAHLPAHADEDLVVVWLWSKQQGVFGYQTALALHQLSDLIPAKLSLVVPLSWKSRRLHVPTAVQRYAATVAETERVWIGNVPVTSVYRTLCDCFSVPLSSEILQQAVYESIQRGLLSQQQSQEFTNRLTR
jgi:predicted transcriptional regulator of viral defense system